MTTFRSDDKSNISYNVCAQLNSLKSYHGDVTPTLRASPFLLQFLNVGKSCCNSWIINLWAGGGGGGVIDPPQLKIAFCCGVEFRG